MILCHEIHIYLLVLAVTVIWMILSSVFGRSY